MLSSRLWGDTYHCGFLAAVEKINRADGWVKWQKNANRRAGVPKNRRVCACWGGGAAALPATLSL